jgi:hypothetical protein
MALVVPIVFSPLTVGIFSCPRLDSLLGGFAAPFSTLLFSAVVSSPMGSVSPEANLFPTMNILLSFFFVVILEILHLVSLRCDIYLREQSYVTKEFVCLPVWLFSYCVSKFVLGTYKTHECA